MTAGDGRVYVSTKSYFGKQQVAALDAKSGSVRWSRDFGDIPVVNPPAFANGLVYVTTTSGQDSFLWALEASTGTVRFRSAYGTGPSVYYAPVIVDNAVYMVGGERVWSFGAINGSHLWAATTNQYDQWTPAVQDGLVYTHTGSYNPRVSVLDVATGKQVYEIPDPKFWWAVASTNLTPVLGGSNNLLATNGWRLISFDLPARAIGWEQRGGFTGTVAVANGLLYVVNNGQVDIRRENDGSLVAPWIPPEGRVEAPVIVTSNLVFASTASYTFAVDLATRQQVWSYPAGGTLALSSQGILFIAQSSGKLAAITIK